MRYRVNADADTNLALVGGFEGLAFEVTNGAALTLHAADAIPGTLGLTGNGSVTLDGTVFGADRTLIDASIRMTEELLSDTYGTSRDLTIINNGALSLANTSQDLYQRRYAINASLADVVNNGSITVTNPAASQNPASAIYYAGTVTNTGIISVSSGAPAIELVQTVINSGTISGTGQAGPYTAGGGITSVGTLINSGIVRFEGDAVVMGNSFNPGSAITNSGTVESLNGTAVRLSYDTILTNEAGGTILGALAVDIASGGTIVNRGTIAGDVSSRYWVSNAATYVADGGTVEGDVVFGAYNDTFLQTGPDSGVSSIVDGGDGRDMWGYALRQSGEVSLAAGAQFVNFEDAAVLALDEDTVVTITAPAVSAEGEFTGDLLVGGSGKVINTATISGSAIAYPYSLMPASMETGDGLVSFENRGTMIGGFSGSVADFDNSGMITAPVTLGGETLTISNAGTITATGQAPAMTLALGSLTMDSAPLSAGLVNSGTIAGSAVGVSAEFLPQYWWPPILQPGDVSVAITNTATGVIAGGTSGLNVVSAALTLDNAGTISGGGTNAMAVTVLGSVGNTIRNSGTLAGGISMGRGDDRVENRGTITGPITLGAGNDTFVHFGGAASGSLIDGGLGTDRFVFNAVGDGALDAGQITAFEELTQIGTGTGIYSGAFSVETIELQGGTLAVAAGQTLSTAGAVTVASGDAGVHVINRGTIAGAVRFGAGNDSFTDHAASVVTGGVNGGEGVDLYRVVLSGDRTGIGARTGFEQLAEGAGTLALALDQDFATVGLAGTNLTATTGGSFSIGHIHGSEAAEAVVLDHEATAIVLGGGDDSLMLGLPDQTDIAYRGTFDGGTGNDALRFASTGPVVIGGLVSGFERISLSSNALVVEGTLNRADDVLAFTSDQAQFLRVGLTGVLNGTVDIGAGNDVLELGLGARLTGRVNLGGGNDRFRDIEGSSGRGVIDGGEGYDIATVGAGLQGSYTLAAGRLTGFERLEAATSLNLVGGSFDFDEVAAGSITIAAESALAVKGLTASTLTVLGSFTGSAELGSGDNSLRLGAGATLNGTVKGGAGYDAATVELAGTRTLAAGVLTGFEHLQTEGTGSLTLTGGTFAFDRMDMAGDLTVAATASLAATRVGFGVADTRLAIAGEFNGAVAGGSSRNTIEVSGNAVFSSISSVEALRMSTGQATVAGQASLGAIALNGGRLLGLTGSTIDAPIIEVAQGALFGSAGTVNGNVSVAGTLSPGASPGTMTINGSVALAGTSISVFEITPTASDKLVINGNLAIAQGATLQILADQVVKPGQSLDLITATGGITGGFSTIVKPVSLFGYIEQRDGRITLLGQFRNDVRYSKQVRGAIDYMNTVLVSGEGTASFVAAVPALVDGNGNADQATFARLTPEVYASAGQIAVEQGLELAATGRSAAFAAPVNLSDETPAAFTFASALGSTRTLERGSNGIARAHTNGYGFVGGLGFGGSQWSVGAFVGYLDSRQVLTGRGASTELDGVVAGVHGRWTGWGGIGVKATIAYSGGNATTRRALPGGTALSATGEYDLKGWTGDINIDYAVPLGRNWTVRPGIGVTAIRTIRDGVAETGHRAFALEVGRRREDAVFVDGALTFRGGVRESAVFRPYLTLGARYQLDGRTPYAVAALGGGGFGLEADGVARARLLATATAGADVALSSELTLFGALSSESGDADNRASARAGLRLAF